MQPHEKEEPFHDPLEALGRLLSQFGYRGVVIGGIAVGLLSRTRFTEDLDALVLLSIRVKSLVKKMLIKFDTMEK